MTHLVLHIFPESSLASSLITTVWIGVFVTCFFNLRFGWNKSGLIIPGYLVPLLILKPWSAVAIIIEGLVTYLIVKLISEFGSFSKMWSNYFGRDRFFLLFLVAICVRILFDEVVFPEISILLGNYFNIDFVYKGGLYSIGLVIVALTANHFWNSGIKRGFPHLLIILLCTFLIIKYILLPYTNFRLNNIIYLYEDIATSIAASPKAYIILTVTAFIASRMNLLYGWEFSGIIIPALLALQWYFPWKIASSILEAGIIYGIATLLLKSRFFLNSTIEGARKILLFFNIAFFYKLLLGFILPLIYSDAPVTDTFGLGYMLTSLIAIKMYDKKIGLKMTRSVLQASITSVILATLFGFFLLFLPNPFNSNKNIITLNDTIPPKVLHTKDKSLTSIISSQQVKLYGNSPLGNKLSNKDIEHFETGLMAFKYYSNTQSNSSLSYAVRNLNKVSFKIRIIQDKYILLTEKNWKKSRGIYLISMAYDANNLLISIPYPIGHPALVTSSINLLERYNARALAISSSSKDNSKSVLKEENTIFSEFLKFFSQDNDIITLLKQNKHVSNLLNNKKMDINKTYVIYPDTFSKNNSVVNYKEVFDTTKNIIDPEVFSKYKNLNNSSTLVFISDSGLIHQLSNIPEYKNLASNSMHKILGSFDEIFKIKEPTTKGLYSYLSSLFHAEKKAKYSKHTITNQKAKFIDLNILSKLVGISLDKNITSKSKDFLSTVKFIDFAANDMDYSLSLYTVKSRKPEYLVFTKKYNSKKKKIEGAYFFRIDKSNPCILEVFNLNYPQSLHIANLLSHKLLPSITMFAISPMLDMDLSELTDITIPAASLFNLVNQVSMREIDACYEYKDKKDKEKIETPLVLQIRILKNSKHIKYDKNTLYISTYYGKYKYSQLSKSEKDIYDYFKKLGFKIKFAHGSSAKTSGLEVIRVEQSRYITSTLNFDFMILWFSPEIDILDKKKGIKDKNNTDVSENSKSNENSKSGKDKKTDKNVKSDKEIKQ